ncbi:hypothetical protein EDD21DRAFT_353430 [Dissophora ornata]|nr:hypothetical protein EDD21DRAFT_353430 [Dissophora ornata]
MKSTTCDNSANNSTSALLQKRDADGREATITTASIEAYSVEDVAAEQATDPAAESIKKPTPKRAMVLIGMPPPALPPRPVFPPELDQCQIQSSGDGGSSKYNAQMQTYLSSLRQDYEKQLKGYDLLKKIAHKDEYFASVVVEELDAMDEDPFTLDSFENLMRLHASKGKDFILARVTTQDPNDETKLYHSYYGAHQINKVLFRTQPDEGLLHRMKARNPLNNMLVVGDVHYYIISAQDINAIKPSPAVRSSNSSVSSHSSRMSRYSKLAAQAIASQPASARSSPILGSDMSLFSRSSDVESPISTVPPLLAMMVMEIDQHDGNTTSTYEAQPDTPSHGTSSRSRRGSCMSTCSASTTPTVPQVAFQPGKPSRLRQAINSTKQCTGNSQISGSTAAAGPTSSLAVIQDRSRQGELNFSDPLHSPTSPPLRHQHNVLPTHQSQSPLFQSLMDGRIRSRSNTTSSIRSNKSNPPSPTSAVSDRSHGSKSSAATDASEIAIFTPSAPPSPSSTSPTSASLVEKVESATYTFKYLASDDDFLLRSVVRQNFKVNALEPWDAVLFTISNNALREYSGNQVGEPTPQPPSPTPTSSLTQNQGPSDNQTQTPAEDAPPSRSATELGHSNVVVDVAATQNSANNGVIGSLGMSRSMPSLPSAGSGVLSTPVPPSSSSSSSSLFPHSTSPPSFSSASTTSTTAGPTLSKHDSGHASTAFPPTVDSTYVGIGSSSGHSSGSREGVLRPIPTNFSSVSEGHLLHHHHRPHYHQHAAQQRKSSGTKIRQAFSKFFSLA